MNCLGVDDGASLACPFIRSHEALTMQVSKSQKSNKNTAVVDEDDDATRVQNNFRISTSRLERGMFVANLDRPWTDSPFIIQGFQVDRDDELQTLRQHCRFVYVDLNLSKVEVADKIRMAEELDDGDGDIKTKGDFRSLAQKRTPVAQTAVAPKGKDASLNETGTYRVRLDAKTPVKSQARFREFIRASAGDSADDGDSPIWQRLWSGLTEMFSKGAGSGRNRTKEQIELDRIKLQREFRATLPPGAKMVQYKITKDVPQELPRARKTFANGETVLKSVLHDIRNGNTLKLENVEAAVDEMVDSMIANPDALMWISKLRDEASSTYSHGVRVSLYMIALGRDLGFPKDQLGNLGLIGMLADVGKLKMPRALLDKPGMLTSTEYALMKTHVDEGLRALAETGKLRDEVELGISQHHERMDGSGYPKKLAGDAISIFGRVAGIADSFTALTTTRPYANALAPQDAMMHLYQWAGTAFHEALIEQFVQSVGVFPVGSMVELNSGEIAVVVAQNRVRRLEPKVLLLTWPDKRPLANPIECDLFQKNKTGEGQKLRIARGLPSGAYGLKMRDYYADNVANDNNLV